MISNFSGSTDRQFSSRRNTPQMNLFVFLFPHANGKNNNSGLVRSFKITSPFTNLLVLNLLHVAEKGTR